VFGPRKEKIFANLLVVRSFSFGFYRCDLMGLRDTFKVIAA